MEVPPISANNVEVTLHTKNIVYIGKRGLSGIYLFIYFDILSQDCSSNVLIKVLVTLLLCFKSQFNSIYHFLEVHTQNIVTGQFS